MEELRTYAFHQSSNGRSSFLNSFTQKILNRLLDLCFDFFSFGVDSKSIMTSLLLPALVSAVCGSFVAAALFMFLWWLWLRKLVAKLAYIQHALKQTQQALVDHQKKLDLIRSDQMNLNNTLRENLEEVENSQVGLIEIDPSISPEERERLIRYLRAEGFLP